MTKERCNCDASCGENRYHDVGDAGCRYKDNEDYYRQYPKMRPAAGAGCAVCEKWICECDSKNIKVKNIPEDFPFRTMTRWGDYRVISHEKTKDGVRKVKILTVHPGKNISKQYHSYRKETWFIISGFGQILISEKVYNIQPHSSWSIPLGVIHQVRNNGTENLVILEIQEGSYCEEDDIMRLQEAWTEK